MASLEIRKPRSQRRRAAAIAFSAFWSWKRPGRLGAISKTVSESASMMRARTLPSCMDSRSTRKICPGSMTGQPRALARARITSLVSGRCSARTTGTPGFRIPAFSAAIAFSEWPKKFSWSKSMQVMMVTRGERMLVASRRPPKPTSKTAKSTRSRAKYSKAKAVTHSK